MRTSLFRLLFAEFRLEEECSRSHHLGLGPQTGENLDASAASRADRHRCRLEASPCPDEHDLAAFHRLNGAFGKHDPVTAGRGLRRDANPQTLTGCEPVDTVGNKNHGRRPALRVNTGCKRSDNRAAGLAVAEFKRRSITRSDAARISGRDRSFDLDAAGVSDTK